MTQFKLPVLIAQGENLLKEAKRTLAAAPMPKVAAKANDVPTSLTPQDKDKINVVFVGQSEAGKSTILSLLTGHHLAVGRGITTEHCETYDWEGIRVTDTPGVHTEIRPEHDAITYEAIAKADLIVFVITYKGFEGHLAPHFHNLAIEHNKGSEMMLVVNIMDETSDGNTPQQQDNIFSTMAQVIKPYTRNQLYTTFISAKYWGQAEDAKAKNNLTRADEKRKRSGADVFIANLNRFVDDKGLTGRYTTSLYMLERTLTDALASCHSGDDCQGMREMLTLKRRALVETRDNVQRRARLLVRQTSRPVRSYGNEIADGLSTQSDERKVNAHIERRIQDVEEVYGNAVREFEKIVDEENSHLEDSFCQMAQSQFGQDVLAEVNRQISKIKARPETMRNVNKWAGRLYKFGNDLAGMAKGPNASGKIGDFFKLGEASGSQAHNWTLKIGHVFGHKFKPWEAVRISTRIGQVSKVLGVAGALIGVVSQIWTDQQEEKAEKSLANARGEIRRTFDDAADVIDMEFDKNAGTWIEASYNKAIHDIDDSLREIDGNTQSKDDTSNAIRSLLEKTHKLIEEFHS